ncbi:MAG: riboflavin synthase, partial [Candidatus Omnitrophota bacterium]
MFTGIVKDIGRVKKIVKRVNLWRVGINCLRLYKESSLSDSISVNGVCLTLTEKKQDLLFFDIIKSTLENTNLKRLKIGSYVNIELSLKVGERVGGHFVLGHIDCESKIKGIKRNKDFYTFEIELPKRFKHLVT